MQRMILVWVVLMWLMPDAARAEHGVTVQIEGLMCEFCAASLEHTFERQPQIVQAQADLATGKLTLIFAPDNALDHDTIARIITDAGFSVIIISHD